VPGPADNVCIKAAGTYTVTLPPAAVINLAFLQVGDGVARVTLRDNAGGSVWLIATSGIHIAARSTVSAQTCGIRLDAAGTITNAGTVNAADNCAGNYASVYSADTVVNSGTLSFKTVVTGFLNNGGLFQNTGSIVVDTFGMPLNSQGHPTIELNAGSISGTGAIIVDAATAADRPRLEWNGGTIAVRANGQPALYARADRLVLGSSVLSGWLRLLTSAGDTTTIQGNIGQNVHLLAAGCDQTAYELARPGGAPTVNAGELVFDYHGSFPSCASPSLTVSGTGLVNNGIVSLLTGSGAATHLQLDSLVNQGTMSTSVDVDFGAAGAVFRNRGALTVAGGVPFLMNAGSKFAAGPASTQSGPLTLQSARLSGEGTLGDVTSNAGVITPGADVGPTLGGLTFHSLVLDAASSLEMEVAGTNPASHDRVAVTDDITYGGSLVVIPVPPYVGGRCGDVIRLISDTASAPRGAFDTLVGFQPAPAAYWRPYNPVGEYDIVGYNPLSAIFVSSAPLAVAESGATAAYDACLSHAPTSSVTITATSSLGQLSFVPAPLVVGTQGWELPQRVTVSAIDDAVIEPPKADLLSHSVTSADPTFDHTPVSSIPVAVTDNDGSADLALTITSSPGPVPVGTKFVVDFTVTNSGPTLSTGATFTVPPVGGVAYDSATGATCTPKPVVGLSCTLKGSAAGGTVTFSITARATAVGIWPVTMTVTGDQADPNAANNVKVKNITVN
jgi:hypothetical protein